ncbi:MAG: hypothetical protein JSV78_11335 [Phycisphaerales bacterium]|nr:MAG: hypothetical protein JSV78_11335 [Phycisphaerales bacterium]
MTSRLFTAVLAVAMVFPVVAFAQTSPSGQPVLEKRAVREEPPDENLAITVLRREVEGVDWPDASFEYVVDWLKDQGDINVVVNWPALTLAAVEKESVVELSLKRVKVADVLNEAIRQLGEGGEVLYRASKNTIRISTKEDFDRKMHLRVYDVTDILIEVTDFYDSPEIDLEQQQQSGGQGAQQGTPVFSSSGSGNDDQTDEDGERLRKRMEDLVALIEEVIDPLSWDYNGGKGTVRFHKRTLIVSNSIEVHEQIAGFFEEFE